MRGIAFALGALTVLACSGEGESHVALPEPPPSSTTPPPTTTAPPPSTEPTPEPIDSGVPPVVLAATTTPAQLRGLYVAELDITEPASGSFHVDYPDAAIGARLDRALGAEADLARDASAAASDDDEPFASCYPLTATLSLASIACTGMFAPDDRSDSLYAFADIRQVEVAGDDVRPTTVDDAILPGSELDALLDDALADAFARSNPSEQSSVRDYRLAATGLTADGLHAFWIYDRTWGGMLEGEVPYARLVDRIRADGPVARMLHMGDFADPPPAADAPPVEHGPWVIGAVMPLAQAAARWTALPSRLRTAVSFHPSAEGARFAITAAVDVDTARAVATALGGTLAPDASDAPLNDFFLGRANASVNLRESNTSAGRWITALPRGAVVTLVTQPDQLLYPDLWVQVVAAPGLVGWAASRFLDDERCTIDPATTIAALPEEARDAAAQSVLSIRTTAIDAGHVVDAALFLAPSGDHTYVSLRRFAGGTCSVGAELSSWTIDGRGVDALVTRTARRTGETLVLVQTEQGRTSTCLALRRGTPTPVWERAGLALPSSANEVHAPALVGPSGRGYWPLSIVRRGQPIVTYRWDGATLTTAAP